VLKTIHYSINTEETKSEFEKLGHYSRGSQLLGHSIVSHHFMEPEGWRALPSVPILSQTNPLHITWSHLSKINPNIIEATHVLVFLAASFALAFPPRIYTRTSSSHSRYMRRPFHPSSLDYCNYTWRKVQIMSFLICSFLHSPPLIPLGSKYPPQHPVPKYPKSMVFP
jgi:hypothetical protein